MPARKTAGKYPPGPARFAGASRNHPGLLATAALPGGGAVSALGSEKGLSALNAIPKGQSATVGSSLVTATSEGTRDWSKIGDLVGGAIGGFTKSMTG